VQPLVMHLFGIVWDGSLGRPHPISVLGTFDMRHCGSGGSWHFNLLSFWRVQPLAMHLSGIVWDGPLGRPHPISVLSGAFDMHHCGSGGSFNVLMSATP